MDNQDLKNSLSVVTKLRRLSMNKSKVPLFGILAIVKVIKRIDINGDYYGREKS